MSSLDDTLKFSLQYNVENQQLELWVPATRQLQKNEKTTLQDTHLAFFKLVYKNPLSTQDKKNIFGDAFNTFAEDLKTVGGRNNFTANDVVNAKKAFDELKQVLEKLNIKPSFTKLFESSDKPIDTYRKLLKEYAALLNFLYSMTELGVSDQSLQSYAKVKVESETSELPQILKNFETFINYDRQTHEKVKEHYLFTLDEFSKQCKESQETTISDRIDYINKKRNLLRKSMSNLRSLDQNQRIIVLDETLKGHLKKLSQGDTQEQQQALAIENMLKNLDEQYSIEVDNINDWPEAVQNLIKTDRLLKRLANYREFKPVFNKTGDRWFQLMGLMLQKIGYKEEKGYRTFAIFGSKKKLGVLQKFITDDIDDYLKEMLTALTAIADERYLTTLADCLDITLPTKFIATEQQNKYRTLDILKKITTAGALPFSTIQIQACDSNHLKIDDEFIAALVDLLKENPQLNALNFKVTAIEIADNIDFSKLKELTKYTKITFLHNDENNDSCNLFNEELDKQQQQALRSKQLWQWKTLVIAKKEKREFKLNRTMRTALQELEGKSWPTTPSEPSEIETEVVSEMEMNLENQQVAEQNVDAQQVIENVVENENVREKRDIGLVYKEYNYETFFEAEGCEAIFKDYLQYLKGDISKDNEQYYDDPNSGWYFWKNKTFQQQIANLEKKRGGIITSKEEFVYFYTRIVSETSKCSEQSFVDITVDAMAVILDNPAYFINGVDPNNLPAGFIAQPIDGMYPIGWEKKAKMDSSYPKQKRFVLHYDPILAMDQKIKNPEFTTAIKKPFSKFEPHYKTLDNDISSGMKTLLENKEKLNEIYKSLGGDQSIDKFRQLLQTQGLKSFEQLLTMLANFKDSIPTLYKVFLENYLLNSDNFAEFANQDTINAITLLSEMNDGSNVLEIWHALHDADRFNDILACKVFGENQDLTSVRKKLYNPDFAGRVNAFSAWQKKLNAEHKSRSNFAPLQFQKNIKFNGIPDFNTGLNRLFDIITNAPSLQMQVDYLHDLDLSQYGAVVPARISEVDPKNPQKMLVIAKTQIRATMEFQEKTTVYHNEYDKFGKSALKPYFALTPEKFSEHFSVFREALIINQTKMDFIEKNKHIDNSFYKIENFHENSKSYYHSSPNVIDSQFCSKEWYREFDEDSRNVPTFQDFADYHYWRYLGTQQLHYASEDYQQLIQSVQGLNNNTHDLIRCQLLYILAQMSVGGEDAITSNLKSIADPIVTLLNENEDFQENYASAINIVTENYSNILDVVGTAINDKQLKLSVEQTASLFKILLAKENNEYEKILNGLLAKDKKVEHCSEKITYILACQERKLDINSEMLNNFARPDLLRLFAAFGLTLDAWGEQELSENFPEKDPKLQNLSNDTRRFKLTSIGDEVITKEQFLKFYRQYQVAFIPNKSDLIQRITDSFEDQLSVEDQRSAGLKREEEFFIKSQTSDLDKGSIVTLIENNNLEPLGNYKDKEKLYVFIKEEALGLIINRLDFRPDSTLKNGIIEIFNQQMSVFKEFPANLASFADYIQAIKKLPKSAYIRQWISEKYLKALSNNQQESLQLLIDVTNCFKIEGINTAALFALVQLAIDKQWQQEKVNEITALLKVIPPVYQMQFFEQFVKNQEIVKLDNWSEFLKAIGTDTKQEEKIVEKIEEASSQQNISAVILAPLMAICKQLNANEADTLLAHLKLISRDSKKLLLVVRILSMLKMGGYNDKRSEHLIEVVTYINDLKLEPSIEKEENFAAVYGFYRQTPFYILDAFYEKFVKKEEKEERKEKEEEKSLSAIITQRRIERMATNEWKYAVDKNLLNGYLAKLTDTKTKAPLNEASRTKIAGFIEAIAEKSKDSKDLNLKNKSLEKLSEELAENFKRPLEFADFDSDTTNVQSQEFLAYIFEICARTSATEKPEYPNLVQQIALSYLLLADEHTFFEMPTGWGKTVFFRCAAAISHFRGKTVNFVTSNAILAKDALTLNQAFFDECRIPARLITETSGENSYQKDAVHFSTAQNLNLYFKRQKIDSQRDNTKTQDIDEKQNFEEINKEENVTSRINTVLKDSYLLIDEADKILKTTTPGVVSVPNTNKKFASEHEEQAVLKNLYKAIVYFVEFKNVAWHKTNSGIDIPLTIQTQLDTLYKKKCGIAYSDQERYMSDHCEVLLYFLAEQCPEFRTWWNDPNVLAELEKWIQATESIAKVPKESYLLGTESMERKLDKTIDRYQKVINIEDSLTEKQMRYSEGLHQVMVAQHEIKAGEDKTSFDMPVESDVVAISDINTLVKQHIDLGGKIIAGSGTPGDFASMTEFQNLYHLKNVSVPTLKESQLKYETAVFCVGDNEQAAQDSHFAELWKQIKNAKSEGKHRPALVSFSDIATCKLFAKFVKEQPDQKNADKVQLYTTEEHYKEVGLADILEKAGHMDHILISNISKRGTDIRLAPGVEEAGGLQSLIASEFEEDEEIQIQGRAGRQGQKGSTRTILAINKNAKNAINVASIAAGVYQNPGDKNYQALNQYYRQQQKEIVIPQTMKRYLSNRKEKIEIYFDDLLNEWIDKAKEVNPSVVNDLFKQKIATLKMLKQLWKTVKKDQPQFLSVDSERVQKQKSVVWIHNYIAEIEKNWAAEEVKLKAIALRKPVENDKFNLKKEASIHDFNSIIKSKETLHQQLSQLSIAAKPIDENSIAANRYFAPKRYTVSEYKLAENQDFQATIQSWRKTIHESSTPLLRFAGEKLYDFWLRSVSHEIKSNLKNRYSLFHSTSTAVSEKKAYDVTPKTTVATLRSDMLGALNAYAPEKKNKELRAKYMASDRRDEVKLLKDSIPSKDSIEDLYTLLNASIMRTVNKDLKPSIFQRSLGDSDLRAVLFTLKNQLVSQASADQIDSLISNELQTLKQLLPALKKISGIDVNIGDNNDVADIVPHLAKVVHALNSKHTTMHHVRLLDNFATNMKNLGKLKAHAQRAQDPIAVLKHAVHWECYKISKNTIAKKTNRTELPAVYKQALNEVTAQQQSKNKKIKLRSDNVILSSIVKAMLDRLSKNTAIDIKLTVTQPENTQHQYKLDIRFALPDELAFNKTPHELTVNVDLSKISENGSAAVTFDKSEAVQQQLQPIN